MDSVYDDILAAVQRKIRSLALDGLRDEQVRIGDHGLFSRGMPEKGITLVDDVERHGQGTMNEDEIGYPVVLFLQVGQGGSEHSTRLRYWRESIYNDFNMRREPLTTYLDRADVTPLRCNVNFGNGRLSQFWRDRWSANHLAVWCWIRRVRT
ncbi:MAG: hypothetical protein R6U98_17775 [Pirellulaceae bacterium]